MPELNEADAIKLAVDYYSKRFTPDDATRLVGLLLRVDIVGIEIHAYKQGVLDERGER